jgi:hypothetical protein
MFSGKPLNLFYEEPDPDRWFKFDHYPRKIIRRIVRGRQRPGGVMMVALNLMRGFDKISVPYRLNDYGYIKKHKEEIACIIGKPHLLFERKWENPIIFGAGIFSHPSDYPDLLKEFPNIKRILVPGPWIQQMFKPWYGNMVTSWPTGIDTGYWSPPAKRSEKKFDFLIYDKLNRDRDSNIANILDPILKIISDYQLTCQIIRYGAYEPSQLKLSLNNSRAAIFLSESETQGMAYQQMLAAGVPVLAWDRGGYWQDPFYFPHKVKYQPVSSVPYWDDRCGLKFTGANDFGEKLKVFLTKLDEFKSRDYIMENLTLEICAEKYLEIYRQVEKELE